MWADGVWAWLQPSVEAYISCHDRNKWCAKHAINICITAWLKWSSIVTKSSLTRPVASFSTFQTMPFGTAVSFGTTQRKRKSCTLHCDKSFATPQFLIMKHELEGKQITYYHHVCPYALFWRCPLFLSNAFLHMTGFADLQRWMKLANSRLVHLKQCLSNIFCLILQCDYDLWGFAVFRLQFISPNQPFFLVSHLKLYLTLWPLLF